MSNLENFIYISLFVFTVLTFFISRAKDSSDNAVKMEKVQNKLNDIKDDTQDIKSRIDTIEHRVQSDHDTLTILTRDIKAIWRVIDGEKTHENIK